TRLPVIPIIFGAFQLAWLRRYRLAQVVAVPSLALILIGTYWIYAGRLTGTDDSIAWALFVLQTLAFTPFAVPCHRLLLLGEGSLPRYGIMGWKKREIQFFIWLLIAILVSSFVMIIATMILGGIVANLFTFQKEDWQGWLGWILMTGCQLFA